MLQVAARPPYNVPIHTAPIIYRLVETISKAVADLLPKITETRVHGEATVQQIFEITIKGQKDPMKVAGCKVGNGVFQKGRKARVMRGGIAIHTGSFTFYDHLSMADSFNRYCRYAEASQERCIRNFKRN